MKKSLHRYFHELLSATICMVFHLLTIFLENLSVHTAYSLGKALGKLLYTILGGRRRQIYDNLSVAYPEGTPFPKREFVCSVFIHACYTFLDFFLAHRLMNRETYRNFIDGTETVDFLIRENEEIGKGIIITGHIGSFITAARVLYSIKYSATIVIRFPNPLWLTRVVLALFAKSGEKIVDRELAYENFKELLARGGYPVILLDQHGRRKSLLLEFFGQKAYTAAGPAALARQFQVPLYVCAVVRVNPFRFKIHVEKVVPIVTGNKQADLENMTRTVNHILEKYVRQYPEQWFSWMHRRWR